MNLGDTGAETSRRSRGEADHYGKLWQVLEGRQTKRLRLSK